jgi:hypothetical protein
MKEFINVKNDFCINEYTYFLTIDGISKPKDLKDNDIIIDIIGSSQKKHKILMKKILKLHGIWYVMLITMEMNL